MSKLRRIFCSPLRRKNRRIVELYNYFCNKKGGQKNYYARWVQASWMFIYCESPNYEFMRGKSYFQGMKMNYKGNFNGLLKQLKLS